MVDHAVRAPSQDAEKSVERLRGVQTDLRVE
jgi:hypothetical protein